MTIEYWVTSGVLWEQIVKALNRSSKTLTIKGGYIIVGDKSFPDYVMCFDPPTIDTLSEILRECL